MMPAKSMTASPVDRGHFLALDGLRGIAAIIVMMHHASGSFAFHNNIFTAGYLAVDFFFMLSGFVISHAYDRRFEAGLPVGAFMQRRLQRLWPTLAIGIIMGAVAQFAQYQTIGLVLVGLIAGLCFLPMPNGHNGIFSQNGVEWSLMLELWANIVHATLLYRRSTRQLCWLAGFFGLLLFLAAARYGSLGFGDRGDNWIAGPLRIGFPYVMGMVIYRLRSKFPVNQGWAWVAFAALPAVLIATGFVDEHDRWLIEPGMVICLFPLIIIGTSVLIVPAGWRTLITALGLLSYPLYAFHLPIISIGFGLVGGDDVIGPWLILAVAIVIAYLWGAHNDPRRSAEAIIHRTSARPETT